MAQQCPTVSQNETDPAKLAFVIRELAQRASLGREVIRSARDYFVRADGSDNNTGAIDSAAGAFLTLQKFIDTAAALDLNGLGATGHVGSGTYTSGAAANAPFVGGSVTLQGDLATPSNVVISTTNANAIQLTDGAFLSLGGFKITTAGASAFGITVLEQAGAIINGLMEYGATGNAAINYSRASTLHVTKSYTISGNQLIHIRAQQNSAGLFDAGLTVTVTNTPNFSSAFFVTANNASTNFNNIAYTGAATGTKYAASANATALGTGLGANFPGDVAGTSLSGAQIL